MTKYYCDRCEKEIVLSTSTERYPWSCVSIKEDQISYMLCKECKGKLNLFLHNAKLGLENS